MNTLNERIKAVRKELGLSQADFAKKIGISQRSVSWGEQPGNNVPDNTVKALCMAFHINESWLRDGIEPMHIHPPTFSLDQFVKDHGMSDIELRILKLYFELDPKIRHDAISYFLNGLAADQDNHPKSAEELEEKFPPEDISSHKIG